MGKRLFVAIFCFLMIIFSSRGRSENYFNRDVLVRNAAISWIEASELDDTSERLNACKQNIKEYLPILEWILDGEKIADIFMGSSLSFFIPPKTLEKMQIIDQFVDKTAFIREAMLGILNSVNPRLQNRIYSGSKWIIFKLAGAYLPSQCEKLLAGIKNNISEAKFSDSDFIHLLKNQENGLSFEGVPEKIRAYLKLILDEYYDNLAFKDKSRIIRGLLELPTTATTSEQLTSVLMRSGPILQKSFQLFGSDVKDPLLLEVMGKLRSQIKAFSSEKVDRVLSRELGGDIFDFFKDFNKQPIAAATIGQVHMGTLLTGQSVVVKIKRPGIERRVSGELTLLRSLTEDAAIISFIDEIEKIMKKELDFLLEKKNLKKAKEIYENSANEKFKVISPLSLLAGSNNVIVMEKARGKQIYAAEAQLPEQVKVEALLHLLEKWFEEALFGSGFFHADLHGGNVFLEPTSSVSRIPLIDSDFSVSDYHENQIQDYKLWLIDFGSVGALSDKDASSLLKLIVGLAFKSNFLILEALQSIMSISDLHIGELEKFIENMWIQGADELKYLDKLFNKVIAMNLLLPENMILFYRGKALIEKQINVLVENIKKESTETNKGMSKLELTAVYHKVMQRNILRELLPLASLTVKNKRKILDKSSRKFFVNYYLDLIAD